MGIGRTDVDMVVRLREQGFFAKDRSVVEIGAQQMSSNLFRDQAWIGRCSTAFQVAPREFSGPSEAVLAHGATESLHANAPHARGFWHWLGFDYAALDVDGSEGSVPVDLNYDPAPPALHGRASLVTNCGTTEHVANQLNAFKVIHDLTAVGGVMLHSLPAQGYLNHGLVNYNPKFFWSLSAANAYKWLAFDFRQLVDSPYTLPDNIVSEMQRLPPRQDRDWERYSFADSGILVVLEKTYDLPFVAPIDVPPGSATHNSELKRRYWSVFDTERFHERLNDLNAGRR